MFNASHYDSVTNFMNWCLPDKFNGWKLQEKSGAVVTDDVSQRNKVIFCHDMMGGYLDDANLSYNDNIYAYRFLHWNLIDIFIYFSHHFITVPPTAWIYLAHKNGVQCLGTFIIEPGEWQNNFVTAFVDGHFEVIAKKLTDIKEHFRFDGWLVNIEYSVPGENVVKNVVSFLNLLKSFGNEVIWYDSLTKEGKIDWQNCLNEKNKLFYDCCDNIFTNYCWSEDSLRTSMITSNGENHKVFVGIDCFGRGCPGGGKFNCDAALRILEKFFMENKERKITKFSIALFAPGWCYESISESDRTEKLDQNISKFFHLLEPYLHPELNNRQIFRQLPFLDVTLNKTFKTCFNVGQGLDLFKNGIEAKEGRFNFLMQQDIVPAQLSKGSGNIQDLQILPHREFGFNAHSCMKLIFNENVTSVELFRCSCRMDIRKSAIEFVLGMHENSSLENPELCLSFVDHENSLYNYNFLLKDRKLLSINKNARVSWYGYIITFDKMFIDNTRDILVLQKVELFWSKCFFKEPVYLGQLDISEAALSLSKKRKRKIPFD